MIVSNFAALFDACVLYSAPLSDFVMQLVQTGLFRAKWTDKIHQEWIDNLLENRPDLARSKLERRRDLMNKHAEGSLVTDYEDLIPSLQLPDSEDRHVLAAAIRGRADVIVTNNLKHFPRDTLAKFGIEAQHPDQFFTTCWTSLRLPFAQQPNDSVNAFRIHTRQWTITFKLWKPPACRRRLPASESSPPSFERRLADRESGFINDGANASQHSLSARPSSVGFSRLGGGS